MDCASNKYLIFLTSIDNEFVVWCKIVSTSLSGEGWGHCSPKVAAKDNTKVDTIGVSHCQ